MRLWCSQRLLATSEPAGHDYLLLGVERNGVAAVRVQIAKEGILPAGEWEERHGGCYADVHAYHPDLDSLGVLSRRFAVRGEDGSGVSETRAVDQADRVI